VVKKNGLVDLSQWTTDASVLTVLPADDAFRLPSLEIGNFEWWYFDLIDPPNGYVVKLVAHLGTDPLRTKCYPSVAVVARTPHGRTAVVTPFAVEDFQAAREHCDVKIQDAFHAWVQPTSEAPTYYLAVHLPDFSATLQFRGQLPGWKPLRDAVPMQQGRKHAAFSWVVPLPRAEVVGTFSMAGVSYELTEALGYHDHNVWQVGPHAKLFIDNVISQWQWGRFLGSECTVVFMETCFRTHRLRSCLLATDRTMLHSSNNLVEVVTEHVTQDDVLCVPYPTRMTVALPEEPYALQMILQAKEVIDRRDLLAGLPPLLQWCVKRLCSRPAYHGILADTTVRLAGAERHGDALYESMYFRRYSRERRRLG
jgi:hypothetical protein